MVNCILPFNFHFLIFISILLKITETRCDWKPVYYFWINILFVVWVPHVHVSEHFKVCAHLLPSYGWIFRKPVDISRCTSCIRFKYIDLKSGRQPKCEKLRLGWYQNVGMRKLGGTQNARILKLGGTQNAEMQQLDGYQRETLNTGIPRWLLAVGSGSFSVQVSSRFWCGEQGNRFHSSSNVTLSSCSSASVSSRCLHLPSK